MQVATQWQPSYTPYRTVIECKPVREGVHKRAYDVYGRSSRAQQVMALLERSVMTESELIRQTKATNAGHYARTLVLDGMVTFDLLPVTGSRKAVKHYKVAA